MVVIITDKSGRLGNRLFLFAHFIANAKEYNYQIVNFSFDEYARYFRDGNKLLSCTYPSNNLLANNSRLIEIFFIKFGYNSIKLLTNLLIKLKLTDSKFHKIIHLNTEEECELNNSRYLDAIKAKKLILVKGWLFRDRKNMITHYKEVRSHFNPVSEHQSSIEKLMSEIRKKSDIIVGVHIRRGDYKDFSGGEFYYDYETYSKMMLKLLDLLTGKRVHFLICSNEPLNAKYFNDFEFTFGLNHELEDMYSLSRCDYIIGPPSTYTMWASFYGKVPLFMIKNKETKRISLEEFEIITF